MKRHSGFLGAAALATLIAASPALAIEKRGSGDMGCGMMGMGSGMMGSGMMGMTGFGPGVTLTQEQEKKLAALRGRFLQDTAKAQSELIQTRAGLQALLLNPSAKEDVIEAQVQKTAAAHSRLFVLRLRMAREMEGILTKEQREEMKRRSSAGMGMRGPGAGSRGMMNPCGAGSGRRGMMGD